MNLIAQPIRSRANARLRRLHALIERASARRREHCAVIEGEHLLESWLMHRPEQLREVYWRADEPPPPGIASRLAGLADPIECFTLDAELFARISSLENSRGPIAVLLLPADHQPQLGPIDTDAIYLDALQDPGNVGTILRSALAFGVRTVLAAPGCVDLWSPKVLRAAMGSHVLLEIHTDCSIERLFACARVPLRATSSHATRLIREAGLAAPGIWLFGQEGRGLDQPALANADIDWLAIEQSADIESLNVGVAASICLYEQYRQRHAAP
jgi:TrmH family RNA methyltransferase